MIQVKAHYRKGKRVKAHLRKPKGKRKKLNDWNKSRAKYLASKR